MSGRRVWRNSRRDGAGTTRGFHCASSTLWVIWTRSANSHTGRRLSSCRIKGRTDDSIRPRAATIPTFSLAWKGASTDGNRLQPLGGGRCAGRPLLPYSSCCPSLEVVVDPTGLPNPVFYTATSVALAFSSGVASAIPGLTWLLDDLLRSIIRGCAQAVRKNARPRSEPLAHLGRPMVERTNDSFHPTQPILNAGLGGRLGAGRAVPGAKVERPLSVWSGDLRRDARE